MTPEEAARINIDRQLTECGWVLQDVANMNIMASTGVAIREFPLTTGEAETLPATRAVNVYEVTVANNEVNVALPAPSADGGDS